MTGKPYSKLPLTRLELTDKDGIVDSKRFETQEEVDWAWENGYHVPGKPETRDVGVVEEEKKEEVFECDKCDFTTKHKASLSRHMTMEHKHGS